MNPAIQKYILPSKFGPYEIALHSSCWPYLEDLLRSAQNAGFSPRVISSYRSYEHQLRIWNEKLLGKRPCMDFSGNTPLNTRSHTPQELIMAISRWSAFPGFSRHHWGTDIDIVDETHFSSLKEIQLIPKESIAPNGPNYSFHSWLYFSYAQEKDSPISFPYFSGDFSFTASLHSSFGVGPEPWHLSFSPISEKQKIEQSQEFWDRQILRYPENAMYRSFIQDLSPLLFQHYTSYCVKE